MSTKTASDIVQQMVPELQAEGYEVFVKPTDASLPTFMKGRAGFSPDAIAHRNDKNLAIMVSKSKFAAAPSIALASTLMRGHPGWELRVVFLDADANELPVPIETEAAVSDRIAEVRTLMAKGHLQPAFLLGWAILEAAARAVAYEQLQWPQSSGRLVQVLAGEGHLTPSEADRLRELAKKRNQLSHGQLQVQVSAAEMLDFVTILDELSHQPAY
jgi:REase_AHJR-like